MAVADMGFSNVQLLLGFSFIELSIRIVGQMNKRLCGNGHMRPQKADLVYSSNKGFCSTTWTGLRGLFVGVFPGPCRRVGQGLSQRF